MKKVAILTYPLHSNFGSIMQNYAMQSYLRRLGYNPYTFYIESDNKTSLINIVKQTIHDIYFVLKGKKGYRAFRYRPTDAQKQYMDQHTWEFIHANIQLTEKLDKITDLYKIDVKPYDAFIVGSDQVWRSAYLDNITCYYFDFLPDEKKRMSYAASFGVDYLDYSRCDKNKCAELIKKFDIVTVREFEGIDICRDCFGIEAIKVIDPVFLLTKEDYSILANKGSNLVNGEPFLFSYILDWTEEKRRIINKISKKKNLVIVDLLPEKFHLVGPSKLSSLVFPPIYDIIRAFRDASYIVTDSFHGTAFSIIMNRPMSVFLNDSRGNSRLYSILKTFNLKNRIISNDEFCDDSIDFDMINDLIFNQRLFSERILKHFLQ